MRTVTVSLEDLRLLVDWYGRQPADTGTRAVDEAWQRLMREACK